MKLHQSLIITIVSFMTWTAAVARGATEAQGPLVEVRRSEDVLSSYRDRRQDHGVLIGLDYEALRLNKFFSTADGATYDSLFGSDAIPLVHLSIDYKFNNSVGSFTAGVDLGAGTINGNSDRSLDIAKYGVAVKYIMDNIWPEPYVAPYVGINFWKLSTKDKSSTATISEETGLGYNYTAGCMIQLDWIDYETAKQATFNYGLENTFLDVYVTKYAKTESNSDVNTETDLLWGAGLRFEF